MTTKTKILIVAVLAAALAGSYFWARNDQITEGRFNYYGDQPSPYTTTTTIPEPVWEAPAPPTTTTTLPRWEMTPVPEQPTPFETGPKVRPPTGCEEGEERGVDC